LPSSSINVGFSAVALAVTRLTLCTPLALADLAERGLGVAIVPASVPRGRDGLYALPLVPELRGRLVLAWRSGGPMSPAARVLVDKARRLLRVGGRA